MGWTLKDIEKRIVYFKGKLKQERNLFKRRNIKETINSLEGILEYFNEEFDTSVTPFKEVMVTDKHFIGHYHKLNPYILDFADTFSEEQVDFITELNKDTSINPTRIMTVTKEFYDSIKDTRFTDLFLDMYGNHDFYVNFRPATEQNTRNHTAITFNVFNSPEVFLLVNYSKNLNDYLAMIHEYAHAISCRLYTYNSVDFGKYPFNETDAIFFEMLANEQLSKHSEHEIDALVIDLDRFFDYASYAVTIQAKLELYSLLERNRKMNIHDIIKFLRESQRLDRDGIKDVLHEEMYKMFSYSMSYLVAIELFLLYRVDPKKALDALYDFICLSGKSSIDHLNLLKDKYNIVPGKNTHIYFQEIKDRVEGMKNDKKVQYTIK